MERHLADLAEWVPPEAGMFMWCVYSSQPRKGRRARVQKLMVDDRFKLRLPGAEEDGDSGASNSMSGGDAMAGMEH